VEARRLSKSLGWWYRRTFNLTATDPRYLEATPEAMALDFWTDYYARHPQLGVTEFENDDFEADVERMLAEDDDWETIDGER